MPDLKTTLSLRSTGGAMKADGLLASVTDGDGAYGEYDSGSGFARFGAKGLGSVSRGVKIRTLNSGAVVDAAIYAANGDVTLFNLAALMATLTSTTRPLRLCYDGTHYVDFSITSAGTLNINPPAGQSVTVSAFNATGAAVLSGQTRVGDMLRAESVVGANTTGLAGKGVEIYYDGTGNAGVIQAYDRTGSAFQKLTINGSLIDLGTGVAGSRVAGNRFNSFENTTDSGTATVAKTIVTLPATAGIYLVTASIPSAGSGNDVAGWLAVGVTGGTSQWLNSPTLTNGDLTLALNSVLNLQVTLATSNHLNVTVTATRVA